MRTLSSKSIVLVTAIFALAGAGPCLGQRQVEETAWQKDNELAEKWSRITGRYIFQRVCLECHTGAAELTRSQWNERLADFPPDGHPELPKLYKDLTAVFAHRRMVPDEQGRQVALRAFLLAAAPTEDSERSYDQVDLLPDVGDTAPEFTIKDVNGAELSLEKFKGQRNVLLVFSRADW